LPNSGLYDFAHSGHAPHLEEADKFNDFVISLVANAENGKLLKAKVI
jgi:glycerol-3-phosphate cytidylyltransferase-like family protein